MEYKDIKVEKREHLITVTINRPEVMNSINPLTSAELEHAFDDFAADPQAWVCIVTGAGAKAFCAGNDLKFQAQNREKMPQLGARLKYGLGGITKRFDCFKPFIAAVNGFAMGGGFEIALACDIIIASESAKFGLPEPKVGLIAMAGGVHRLTRRIPYHLAMGLILTSEPISARQALQFGIVNEVAPEDKLMETARKWAKKIMVGAPLSIRASKEAVIKGSGMPLDQAIFTMYPETVRMMNSEDVIEGPKAFSEKRKPNWRGK